MKVSQFLLFLIMCVSVFAFGWMQIAARREHFTFCPVHFHQISIDVCSIFYEDSPKVFNDFSCLNKLNLATERNKKVKEPSARRNHYKMWTRFFMHNRILRRIDWLKFFISSRATDLVREEIAGGKKSLFETTEIKRSEKFVISWACLFIFTYHAKY